MSARRPGALLEIMAKGWNRCCEHSFLVHIGLNGKAPLKVGAARALASGIGVSLRTIYKWNAKVREGDYKRCAQCKRR